MSRRLGRRRPHPAQRRTNRPEARQRRSIPTPRSTRRCAPSPTRRRLLAALKNGTFDIIATDHAPHAAPEKRRRTVRARRDVGMSGLEFALPTMLALVRAGHLSLADVDRPAQHGRLPACSQTPAVRSIPAASPTSSSSIQTSAGTSAPEIAENEERITLRCWGWRCTAGRADTGRWTGEAPCRVRRAYAGDSRDTRPSAH